MKKAVKAKDDADTPPAPTKGVLMARANRAKCNNLTDKQRTALMAQAMTMIYGNVPQATPHRR